MSTERMVLAFAGSFILISLILSQLWSSYWLLFTAFVGANLLQSAFTGFCPLAKMGLPHMKNNLILTFENPAGKLPKIHTICRDKDG